MAVKKTKTKSNSPFANLKKGALHRQLGITVGTDIPRTLLRKIKVTAEERTISNPTKKGKRRIKVTKLLKQRVQFALNFSR